MKPLDNLSFDLGYMGSSSFLLTSQSKESQSHQAKRPTKSPKSPPGSGKTALSIAVGTVLTNAGRYSTAMKTENFAEKNAVQLEDSKIYTSVAYVFTVMVSLCWSSSKKLPRSANQIGSWCHCPS